MNMAQSDVEDCEKSLMSRDVVNALQKEKLIPELRIQPIEALIYSNKIPYRFFST